MKRKDEEENPDGGNAVELKSVIPTVNIEDADSSPDSTTDISSDDYKVDQQRHPPSETVGCTKTNPGSIEDNPPSSSKSEPTASEKSLLSPKTDRLVRGTSLKSNREQSPGRQKIVRFADALGLDLTAIRLFAKGEGPPEIPQSAFDDLKLQPASKSPYLAGGPTDSANEKYTLIPLFEQPGGDPAFMTKITKQKVCLENTLITNLKLTGTGKTLKEGNGKRVQVRYTTDDWKSSTDIDAQYTNTPAIESFADSFTFDLNVPHMKPGQKLIFAVKYLTDKEEIWDNNSGENYALECRTK